MNEEKNLVNQGENQVTQVNQVSEEKFNKKSFWELVRFALIAIAIVIPIRVYVAQPFVVSGSSMVPTFADGQYLIVDEISYRFSEPQRDDVIVFRYPDDQTKFFIKRIIGLPGETVDIKGNSITIINKANPKGFVLDQPFIKNPGDNITHFELKDNEYFVMGDNRPQSSDSRYWGAVPRNLIIGRVFLRLLPMDKASLLPGDYKQVEVK
jgi:signal peptidase I